MTKHMSCGLFELWLLSIFVSNNNDCTVTELSSRLQVRECKVRMYKSIGAVALFAPMFELASKN